MNLKKGTLRLLPVVGAICLLAASQPLSTAHAAPSYQVIASGLDNPRGLTFDSMGQLYVAEAGKGGDGPCVESDEQGKSCFGATGAITRVFHGQQERIVTGLPSLAGEDGSASGPVDVAVVHPGLMKVVIGLGGNTELRDARAPKRTSSVTWFRSPRNIPASTRQWIGRTRSTYRPTSGTPTRMGARTTPTRTR